MSLATTGDLVASAASAGSAVLAFNVITIEHADGVDGLAVAVGSSHAMTTRKLNVGTALNVAYTAAIRNFLSAIAEATDPRKYLAAGRQAISDTVADLCRAVAAPLPERVAR